MASKHAAIVTSNLRETSIFHLGRSENSCAQLFSSHSQVLSKVQQLIQTSKDTVWATAMDTESQGQSRVKESKTTVASTDYNNTIRSTHPWILSSVFPLPWVASLSAQQWIVCVRFCRLGRRMSELWQGWVFCLEHESCLGQVSWQE